MVVAADYAFWDLPQRKVFKIHGSLNNVGSIVATEDDYRRCYRNLRSGVLGATLKHLLATKTVLFVGFSFSDPDFGHIYRLLQRQLGDVLPPQFIVTRGGTELAARFPAATVIDTDGTFFVSTLKNELVARGAMLPDENLVRAGAMYAKVADEHIRFTHMVDVKEHRKLPVRRRTRTAFATFSPGSLHWRIRDSTRTGRTYSASLTHTTGLSARNAGQGNTGALPISKAS